MPLGLVREAKLLEMKRQRDDAREEAVRLQGAIPDIFICPNCSEPRHRKWTRCFVCGAAK